jgi:small subunit ribosomal protein S17
MTTEKTSGKKALQGVVISNKMDKTAVVDVIRKKKHPLYDKTITLSKRFKIHDERNECNEGDIVRFIECRPMSKDKHFRLVKILVEGEKIEEVSVESSVEEVLHVEKHIPEEQLQMKEDSEGDEGNAPAETDDSQSEEPREEQ